MKEPIKMLDRKLVISFEAGEDTTTLLAKAEAAVYDAAMVLARYNQSRAAKILGVCRVTLRKKLVQHFGRKYIV